MQIESAINRIFTISMTEREAGILLSVVGRISGPSNGPRSFTSQIFDELTKLQVKRVGELGDSTLQFHEPREGPA